ncbi:MAG: bifunctional diaminohydroxyphosphoribosylaminopyrimidine deaminase/5-amino-6-(5-phosphoribosylamino)uracil reductase RibD [Solirubrobacterales bacterium]
MDSQLTSTDESHLRRALELAEGGRGRVSPNPLVGAVLVRGGEVIGEGFHARLGDLHAERAALADAAGRGHDPAGATMYVTLEPCAHHGRQPPCVEAILAAGVGRVVIASEDPSEKAAGRGPGILRDGGVEVAFASGAEAAAARRLNQPFRKHARTGLPLVTLKLALSLDGQTATPPGAERWISGPASRALVHRWRSESDAIAVGIGTALADDPLLTARPEGVSDPRQPLRVVFDSQARLPLDCRLLQTLDVSPVLVITSPDAPRSRTEALEQAGAEILTIDAPSPADRVLAALRTLGDRAVSSLFLEGGRSLATSFLTADQVDASRTFIAPVLLGQPSAPLAEGGPEGERENGGEAPARSAPPRGQDPPRRDALASTAEHIGDDVLVTATFKEW